MSWELAGIHMGYVGAPYQPEFSTLPASVFGAISYSADLAFYRNEIYSIIPEPEEYALVFGLFALAFVFFHRRFQKKQRQPAESLLAMETKRLFLFWWMG